MEELKDLVLENAENVYPEPYQDLIRDTLKQSNEELFVFLFGLLF